VHAKEDITAYNMKEQQKQTNKELKIEYKTRGSIVSPSCFNTELLCGLVVRVPGCRTEMYCASCEVQTEFVYVM
jgi:hypothetical protein